MARPGLSAHWSVPSLLTSLANAGWGPLSGRAHQGLRSTLLGLAAALPHRSGEGKTTAWQVHRRAGLSERWVRHCLHVLEDIGLIEWLPGGVVDGVCQPSFIRIVKRALVELIRAARATAEGALRAHREAVERRLAQLRRTKWVPSPTRKPTAAAVDPHAEPGSMLPPLKGEEPGASAPAFDLSPDQDSAARCALSRQAPGVPAPTAPIGDHPVTTMNALAGYRRAEYLRLRPYMSTTCDHGRPDPYECDACTHEAETALMRHARTLGSRAAAARILGEAIASQAWGGQA